jgi:LPS-assembly lipoprotein
MIPRAHDRLRWVVPTIRPGYAGGWLAVLLLALLLTGCGFKLRGQSDLPPVLAKTYIKTNQPAGAPPSTLAQTLARLLASNRAQILTSPEQATAIIEILKEESKTRTLAANRSGNVREYTLTYSVEYRVTRANGTVLLAHDQITSSRDLIYSETAVLGKQEGENLALRELENDAARTLLRRLEALKATP